MTERFRLGIILLNNPYSVIDNDEPLTQKEVVSMLNALYEENQRLKNKLNFLIELNKPYGTLITENQQLRKENKELKLTIKNVFDKIMELKL